MSFVPTALFYFTKFDSGPVVPVNASNVLSLMPIFKTRTKSTNDAFEAELENLGGHFLTKDFAS